MLWLGGGLTGHDLEKPRFSPRRRGSTSVRGLAAKDCIDVQVRVAALDEAWTVSRMGSIGFRCRPEPWNRVEVSGGVASRKLVFAPPPGHRLCNVHVREQGGRGGRFALLFP